ncbi:MAG: hypothetical protein AAF383_19710 [Cyanobacteria bacterium P01_A01_bin.83]
MFVFRKKISCSIASFVNKLRYFSFKEYIKKLSKSIDDYNPEIIGKSLVDQLERNIFIKFACIILSVSIFSHYPILLTSPKPATIFLLTLIAYCFVSLAFRKEMLPFIIGVYCLIPFTSYAMAYLSYDTGINLFETLPIDVVLFLNMDINNLTQTANKLFLLIASGSVSTILFLILSTLLVRNSLKLVFTAFFKMLRLFIPAKLFAAEGVE